MTDFLSFIILGFIQGVTEFLPVSSTGHLILARAFFGFSAEYGLAVDAVMHLATALAVLLYFRRDILRLAVSFLNAIMGCPIPAEDRTLIIALILGTVPAVAAGLVFQDAIEGVFRNPNLVAYGLISGSMLFFIAERVARHTETLSIKKGVLVGLFQALALIPGVSRSGATISGGLILGLNREAAARFAFLLSFPIILGAGTLKFMELGSVGFIAHEGAPLFAGALVAFLSGLLAIHGLLAFLRSHTLNIFIVYRLALAALILFFL